MARYTRLPHAETVPLASQSDLDAEHLEYDDEYGPNSRSETVPLPPYLLWISVILVCLCILVTILVPFTLSFHSPSSLSRSQLDALPYPDQHLGLDRVADLIPPITHYSFSWPTKIARLNQKLKSAVYGNGVQVFISVEDTTIMQFPIPPLGTDTCALMWTSPPERSPRAKDLETKGDVSEIEGWSIISQHLGHSHQSSSAVDIDFDTVSWNTRPVRGELLGTLDLTARSNSTSVEFRCPTDTDTLTVEFRCLRVACHVRFKQVHKMVPKIGTYSFDLVRSPPLWVTDLPDHQDLSLYGGTIDFEIFFSGSKDSMEFIEPMLASSRSFVLSSRLVVTSSPIYAKRSTINDQV